MLRKHLLATAVGLCSSAVAVSSLASFDMDGLAQGQEFKFAHELLTLQQHDTGFDFFIIEDADGGDLELTGTLKAGTASDTPLFIRFDLFNARFNDEVDITELQIRNPDESQALDAGGLVASSGTGTDAETGSAFRLFEIKGFENNGAPSVGGLDLNDVFTFQLDEGAGLDWLDKDQDISAMVCIYDDLDDALAADDGEAIPGTCRMIDIATAVTGLSLSCEAEGPAVANVTAVLGNYQNFTTNGRQNFGKCSLASGSDTMTVLDPAGSVAEVEQYLGDDFEIQISGDSIGGWADGDGGGNTARLYEDADCFDPNPNDREDLVWQNGLPSTDTLVTMDVYDLDTTAVHFNVCINDENPVHDPIPITENLDVAVLTDNKTGDLFDEVGGIVRNGIVLRFPFVTSFEGADQRIYLTNRGPIEAEYGITCTPADDGISQAVLLPNAHGTVTAGTTLDIRDFVAFGPNPDGGCVVTVAGRVPDIDGTTLLITGGTAQSTNGTTDEGYTGGLTNTLPTDK